MKKEFEVLSSDGVTTYILEFSDDTQKLYVYCNCPAGKLGKWCKHKLKLISGDDSMLVGSSKLADFIEVRNLIKNTKFQQLLDTLKVAEEEIQLAKAKMNKAKKALEKASQNGLAR